MYLLAAITTALVGLRLWARVVLIRQPGLDDILIVLGLIFGLALTPLLIIGNNRYGIGIHKWDISPAKAVQLRKITYWSELLFVWSISCTKISILLFYKRLAAGNNTKLFLWGTWIGVAYNIGYLISYTIMPINMCSPIDAYWNQFSFGYAKKFHCVDEGMALPLGAALSALSDLWGCILPVLLIRGLQMPMRQKLLLYGLFALGFFVVASGIIRLIYLIIMFHTTYDITWRLYDMFVWLILEVYVAIVCASVPALKPLYMSWIQGPIGQIYHSTAHHYQGGSNRSKASHSTTNNATTATPTTTTTTISATRGTRSPHRRLSTSWNAKSAGRGKSGFRNLVEEEEEEVEDDHDDGFAAGTGTGTGRKNSKSSSNHIHDDQVFEMNGIFVKRDIEMASEFVGGTTTTTTNNNNNNNSSSRVCKEQTGYGHGHGNGNHDSLDRGRLRHGDRDSDEEELVLPRQGLDVMRD